MTTKKNTAATKTGGNRGMHSVKGTYERPSVPLTKWLKELPSTIDCLPITLDFMMKEVWRPAGVSDVSAYLLFERWIKGENSRLKTYGKIVIADKNKGVYHYYPKNYRPSKPPALEVRPINGSGINGVFSDINEIKTSLGLLMDAVATLTDKVNSLATTK